MDAVQIIILFEFTEFPGQGCSTIYTESLKQQGLTI
jgi:hypothetical protein